jgi:hypothetical protein
MRRVMCAGYVDLVEDRLYYRKHNGIRLFYYLHVLQRCGDAKYISIKKSTPTPRTDAGVAFVSAVQYVLSIKDSGCIMLGSAHASSVYAVCKIKSKTKHLLRIVLPT